MCYTDKKGAYYGKLAIFEQVVKILKDDSSTKKDLSGGDVTHFRAEISEEMSDEDFLYRMHSYVASFGVMSHISFFQKSTKIGFRLRVYGRRLFVEWADQATGLQKGDEIVAIAGQSISDCFQEHQAYFVSKTAERHYLDWTYQIFEGGCCSTSGAACRSDGART
ncbi:hypothetical protein [Streptococcus sp. 20-1249]|uniref:hypothetical protein n=1 Tax=Streptococcus hepaticus TaxID=3349163 RepID=UPI003749517C